VYEHTGPALAHLFGHTLRQGATLAEEQALMAEGQAASTACNSPQSVSQVNANILLRRHLWWVDHAPCTA